MQTYHLAAICLFASVDAFQSSQQHSIIRTKQSKTSSKLKPNPESSAASELVEPKVDSLTSPNKSSVRSMLILVGIPGSGKSTFASQLVEVRLCCYFQCYSPWCLTISYILCYWTQLAPWKYERVNQDAIGNRKACEALTRSILSKNKIPIIDRCNYNYRQRKYWVDIAKEAQVPVDCIIFSYNTEVCISRCQERQGHETINAKNASMVVRRMSGKLEAPIPIGEAGQNVTCSNEEVFRKIERVSSFDMANDLVGRYLENWFSIHHFFLVWIYSCNKFSSAEQYQKR